MEGNISLIVSTIMNNINEVLFHTDNDDSETDDELIKIMEVRKKRGPLHKISRTENYMEKVVSVLSDSNFKTHFRKRRDTFYYVLEQIAPFLENKNAVGRHPICLEKQLLVTIWTLATPDSYCSICDRFDIGRATGIRTVRRIVDAIVMIMPKFIKWPTREEIIIISESFKRHKGFPNIVGAIDGTHIKIAAPKSDPESYINRKGFHSMQLQVVCDNKMQFLHCYVGNAGSLHDQRVFRLSKLQNICNDENNFPCNGHLIGDAAYMIQKHLLVPFKDNGHLTRIQKNFNYCLSSTRMVIERSIGLLKGRFRTLLDRLPMTRTDLIPKHI